MYILSDRFLGNIKNTKNSYLMGNRFYHSNDGKKYVETVIDKNDIYEGNLEKFYTYIRIYPWIKADILNKIEHMIDNETNYMYLEVHLNNENDITNVYAIKKSDIGSHRLIEPFEVVSPVRNNKVMVYSNGEGYVACGKDDLFRNASLSYTANICFPNMIYRKEVSQYVFKNETLFSYTSKENVINSLDDFITMKEMGR